MLAPHAALRVCAWLVMVTLAGGCASVRYTEPPSATDDAHASPAFVDADEHWQRVAALSSDLMALDPGISSSDAARTAETAIFYPLQLAGDYELISPPLWHNTLVNMGMKPRGLCIDWTEDLLSELQALELDTVSFHWGVANHDAAFRIEHSTAVVSARGQPFASGMVLDPWRDSGRLFWARVDEDPDYVWINLRVVQDSRRATRATDSDRLVTRH